MPKSQLKAKDEQHGRQHCHYLFVMFDGLQRLQLFTCDPQVNNNCIFFKCMILKKSKKYIKFVCNLSKACRLHHRVLKFRNAFEYDILFYCAKKNKKQRAKKKNMLWSSLRDYDILWSKSPRKCEAAPFLTPLVRMTGFCECDLSHHSFFYPPVLSVGYCSCSISETQLLN